MLQGVLQNRTPYWLVIPVGLGFAVIYYFGFRFAIRKFNLKTPGRETDDEMGASQLEVGTDQLPWGILEALGGKDNIGSLDACITRLRVQVNNKDHVNKNRLKELGAAGVLEVGNSVQAIFGTRSETIKQQIDELMKQAENI